MKISAVIVTFNRLELLKECLDSLRHQTIPLGDIIVVNNNSTDGTTEWLSTQSNITVLNQENLGGSGGQYSGIKLAIETGADWVWCMDDDAIPFKNALESLLPYCDTPNVIALACAVIDNHHQVSLVHRGFFNYKTLLKDFGCEPLPLASYQQSSISVGYATFVGIMISKKAIEKIGLPKKELFLHFDDIEYSLRLKKTGDILLIPDSKILHKENSSNHFYNKKVFGKERIRVRYDKLWMRYYVIRNISWGVSKYYGNNPYSYVVLFKYYIKSVFGIILFDDHKMKRIRFLTAAMKDGLNATFINSYDYINNKTKLYQ